ncbi:glucosaminidase domain-containing protein [Silvibacterium acidisoli]|uniref:glucosaminidase domain-containing protein n=1 Tax=Acidobacteriaceae bacterium ZG23-2 TaxID=2883246 RepID=UPI00406D1E5A
MALTDNQLNFLISAARAAKAAGHVFPSMAACEAAVESAWGTSELAIKAKNLFGMKQHTHPILGTLNLPTNEFLNHKWVVVNAEWVEYPDLASCFADRMSTLKRLSPNYPHYAAALAAAMPERYVQEVSLSWSTDPNRAKICISIYQNHISTLQDALK